MMESKVAWVTGGGRGIGAAVAQALAADGHAVAVSSRTLAEVEAVAGALREAGHRAVGVVADVTSRESLAQAHADIKAQLGPVEILVCNAGIAQSASFVNTTPELWDRTLGVNLTGVYNTIYQALPDMLESGFGRVVNVASVAGKVAARYMSAYAASKHGVIGLTRGLAMEVAELGITVNAVCPGFVETAMTDQTVARIVQSTGRDARWARSYLEGLSPQKRLMTPEEVAALVVFLTRPEAYGIHGQSINLDGGGTQV